jgi:hypothetical protein
MVMDMDAIHQAKVYQVFADFRVNHGLQRRVNVLLVCIKLVKSKRHQYGVISI